MEPHCQKETLQVLFTIHDILLWLFQNKTNLTGRYTQHLSNVFSLTEAGLDVRATTDLFNKRMVPKGKITWSQRCKVNELVEKSFEKTNCNSNNVQGITFFVEYLRISDPPIKRPFYYNLMCCSVGFQVVSKCFRHTIGYIYN